MEASRHHARIVWQQVFWENLFWVQDLGSRNGTFLNSMRLSDPLCASAPHAHPLHPGDLLCFGTCARFRVREPRPEQLYNAAQARLARAGPTARELHAKMRQKYQLTAEERAARRQAQKAYMDRAAARRQQEHAPQAPDEAQAEGPVVPRLGPNNAGRLMLEAMGWSVGQGLGKHGQGIQAPIIPQLTRNRRGLGFSS